MARTGRYTLISVLLVACQDGQGTMDAESFLDTGEGQSESMGTGGDGEPLFPPDAPELTLSYSAMKQFDFSWDLVPEADYYQLLESTDGGMSYVQVGGDIMETSTSITVPLYLRLNARYILNACNMVGCKESTSVEVSGALVEAIGYVKPLNTGTSDAFGYGLALSADGNTLAIGAQFEDSAAIGLNGDATNETSPDSGAVYVYSWSGGTWVFDAYVKASNTGPDDRFGSAVALSADGNTLAVSAYLEDSASTGIGGDQVNNGGVDSGAVYVFVRSNDVWSQQAYVKASNAGSGDRFGVSSGSLALSADGNTMVVGADGEDSAATSVNGDETSDLAVDSGAVYVFGRTDDEWMQRAYLKASNSGADDRFGARISLSADGNALAITSYSEDSAAIGVGGNQGDNTASNSGAAYVFQRSNNAWSQQAYIKSSNTGTDDAFGVAVAIAGDGETLAVCSHTEDSSATGIGGNQSDNSASNSGALYVFTKPNNMWTQQAYIKASNTGVGDEFCARVAISEDGNLIAVGAQGEDGEAFGLGGDQSSNAAVDAGGIYVFERGMAEWQQRAYVKASNTGAGDLLGLDISLSADGSVLVAGARGEDSVTQGVGGEQFNEDANNSGAVYTY